MSDDRMNNSSGPLRILVSTGITVSNREASKPFLSYLAYVLGGLLFSTLAIVPVVAGSSRISANSPLVFLVFVVIFDYLNIQVSLVRTTLTNAFMLSLFPMSWLRSAAYRFILMLLDKRVLFYLVPMLAVTTALLARGEVTQAVSVTLLYMSIYLVISEFLFGILPFFRALAERYSARTAMQITMLPVVFFLFIPGIFHIRHEMVLRVPVVSQFVRGFRYAVASDFVPAAAQAGELLSISLVLGAAMAAAGLLLRIVSPVLSPLLVGAGRRKSGGTRSSAGSSRDDDSGSGEEDVDRQSLQQKSIESAFGTVRRLVFLDWRIRQKEERFLLLVIAAPFAALLLAQSITPALHSPMASVILPVFIVTQIAGIPLIDNSYTRRGLQLNHVSILPAAPSVFVRLKFFSTWLPVVFANLLATLILGLRWHMTYYQAVQGFLFSLFIPSVLISLNHVFTLRFNRISRHPLISASLGIVIESLATVAYVLTMAYNFLFGLAFIALLFALVCFRWMPGWRTKLSMEFQNLLEESR